MVEFLTEYVTDYAERQGVELSDSKLKSIVYQLCADDDIWQMIDVAIYNNLDIAEELPF